jgi:hypothetical protein
MGTFATITSGPSNASGQNPSGVPNGLALDKQNALLSAIGTSGQEQLLTAVIVTLQEQTALTTITTAQKLITQALNAWLLNRVGRTVRVKGRGIYTSPGTTTPVLTFALKLGSTSLVSIATAALSATASTNMPFEFEFTLSTAVAGGAAAQIEAHGKVACNITANTPAAAAATYLDGNTAVVGSLNLQQALELDVTIAADLTVTSAQLLYATIEVSGN